jgi:hypothetical protein
VPIASWSSHGRTRPFALAYGSQALVDPQNYNPDNITDPYAPLAPNFQGLSERNGH